MRGFSFFLISLLFLKNALAIEYASNVNINLPDPAITLTVISNSQTNSLIVNRENIEVIVAANKTFQMQSNSRDLTISGQTQAASANTTCVSGVTTLTVNTSNVAESFTISPLNNACTTGRNISGSSGVIGGSGSSGGGNENIPPPRPTLQSSPSPPIQIAPEAPLVFKKPIDLVIQPKVEKIISSSLPQNVSFFLKKFPDLARTFTELGVQRSDELAKLQKINFNLPAINELTLSTLPSDALKLPVDVVFARTPQQIDLNVVLSFDKNSTPRLRLNTAKNQEIKLVVKPEKEAARVTGHLVFNKKRTTIDSRIPLSSLIASALLANLSLLEDHRTAAPDLTVKSFSYVNTGNNVYEANVQMPNIVGSFNLQTVIEYEDKTPPKDLTMEISVDPDGYVYEQLANGKMRIDKAVISLYECRSGQVKECALWNGQKYRQTNPIETDDTGEYNFLVPPGTYYIEAQKDGYIKHVGPRFTVSVGTPISKSIALKPKLWWKTFWFDKIVPWLKKWREKYS